MDLGRSDRHRDEMGARMRVESVSNRTLSKADIEEFESRLGAKLPRAYVDHMLRFNGGAPTSRDFKFADGEDGSTLQYLFPMYPHRGLFDVRNMGLWTGDRVEESFIPIGIDDGGNYVVLGVVGSKHAGEVWFADHEDFPEDDETPLMDGLRKVADTFDDFLSGLHEWSEQA